MKNERLININLAKKGDVVLFKNGKSMFLAEIVSIKKVLPCAKDIRGTKLKVLIAAGGETLECSPGQLFAAE